MLRMLAVFAGAAVAMWATGVLADDGERGPAPATQPEANVVQQRIRVQVRGDGGEVRIGGAGVMVAGGAGGVQVSSSSGPDGSKIDIQAGGIGKLEYSEGANGRRLKLTDGDKVLFDGPVDTQEQREKVSPEAKKLFEQLRKHAPHTGGVGREVVVDPNGMVIGQEFGGGSPLDAIFTEDAGEEFSRRIGEHNVTVAVKGGKSRLLITRGGKTVFDGAIDTPEQWATIQDVPAEIIAEARKMHANMARKPAGPNATSRPDGK